MFGTAEKKSTASAIVISRTSAIERPLKWISSASRL